jgi:hypothetical protein
MGRAIDPRRQTRHHADTGLGQRARKLLRVGLSLRRGVARADHGQPDRMLQGPQVTLHPEQHRRIGHLQQLGREVRVGKAQHMVIGRSGQPRLRPLQVQGQVGGRLGQGLGHTCTDQGTPGTGCLGQNRLRGTERGQQAACGIGAHTGCEQQAQPGAQLVGAHSRPAVRGW